MIDFSKIYLLSCSSELPIELNRQESFLELFGCYCCDGATLLYSASSVSAMKWSSQNLKIPCSSSINGTLKNLQIG
jgi:hypothetical protein